MLMWLRNDNNVARVKLKRIETSISLIITIRLSTSIFGLPMVFPANFARIILVAIFMGTFFIDIQPLLRISTYNTLMAWNFDRMYVTFILLPAIFAKLELARSHFANKFGNTARSHFANKFGNTARSHFANKFGNKARSHFANKFGNTARSHFTVLKVFIRLPQKCTKISTWIKHKNCFKKYFTLGSKRRGFWSTEYRHNDSADHIGKT